MHLVYLMHIVHFRTALHLFINLSVVTKFTFFYFYFSNKSLLNRKKKIIIKSQIWLADFCHVQFSQQ